MFHTKEVEDGGDSTSGQEVSGSHYHVHLMRDVEIPTQNNLQSRNIFHTEIKLKFKLYQASAESFHSPDCHIVDEGDNISLPPTIKVENM